MQKLFTLLLLLFTFTFGCVSATPIHYSATPYDSRTLYKTVYLDQELSLQQEDAIINSLKEWEYATNDKVKFVIKLHSTYYDYKLITSYSTSLIIMNATMHNEAIAKSDIDLHQHGQYTLGYYTIDAGIPEILLVNSRIKPSEYGIVALHEIGHSLGIPHIAEHNGVMHAGIDPNIDHITRNDLIAFCNLYWCDVNKMRIRNE